MCLVRIVWLVRLATEEAHILVYRLDGLHNYKNFLVSMLTFFAFLFY